MRENFLFLELFWQFMTITVHSWDWDPFTLSDSLSDVEYEEYFIHVRTSSKR